MFLSSRTAREASNPPNSRHFGHRSPQNSNILHIFEQHFHYFGEQTGQEPNKNRGHDRAAGALPPGRLECFLTVSELLQTAHTPKKQETLEKGTRSGVESSALTALVVQLIKLERASRPGKHKRSIAGGAHEKRFVEVQTCKEKYVSHYTGKRIFSTQA